MDKEQAKIFAVYDKDGKVTRLVEAQTAKQVKEYLLGGAIILKASALTVARAGLTVEKA